MRSLVLVNSRSILNVNRIQTQHINMAPEISRGLGLINYVLSFAFNSSEGNGTFAIKVRLNKFRF